MPTDADRARRPLPRAQGSADDTAPVEAVHATEDEFAACRARLGDHGLVGSTARRGNPFDNAMIERFMKTPKVAGTSSLAFESAEDVAKHRPRFVDSYDPRRPRSALGYPSPDRVERGRNDEIPLGNIASCS